MFFLYTLVIYVYGLFIRLVALFNPKAKKFVSGRRNLFKKARKQINTSDKIIWFHAASLGEFEQGKPIMEQCKKKFSNHKILITFFSPSGYELRKDTPCAHYVYYLPLDTPSNVKKWLEIVQPEMIVLIKYELWYNLIYQASQKKIPVILVSTAFRPTQFFFKSYGKKMLNIIKGIEHFFVQDTASFKLLKNHQIPQVTLSGDTRFDRVAQLTNTTPSARFVKEFKQNKFTLVAGSTWAKGEEYLVKYINTTDFSLKYIIVPHEINYKRIKSLQDKINKKTILYSQKEGKKISDYNVLIVDAVGFLTSIYPYANIAYVGGAYGSTGIHNILEPATFGLAVFYGPLFEKNQEAKEMIEAKGAKAAHNFHDFKLCIDSFFENKEHLKTYGENALNFVQKRTGATKKVMAYLEKRLDREQ